MRIPFNLKKSKKDQIQHLRKLLGKFLFSSAIESPHVLSQERFQQPGVGKGSITTSETDYSAYSKTHCSILRSDSQFSNCQLKYFKDVIEKFQIRCCQSRRYQKKFPKIPEEFWEITRYRLGNNRAKSYLRWEKGYNRLYKSTSPREYSDLLFSHDTMTTGCQHRGSK